jgi:5,10-methylenetetrahydrofolate reductase
MKIIEELRKETPTLSFEVFPPKTEAKFEKSPLRVYIIYLKEKQGVYIYL